MKENDEHSNLVASSTLNLFIVCKLHILAGLYLCLYPALNDVYQL